MRTLRIAALTTAALGAAVLLLVAISMPPRAIRLAPASVVAATRPVVAGAFHVHTVRSDGTGTIEEVAAAARRAGLAFVIFTDHGDGTRPPQPPAYHSGVLCIDGVEIGTDAGHYAAIGMRPSPYPLGGEGRDVIEDVSRLGGFGIAAHPDSPKGDLRWRDWAAPFDGLEWLNADSEWRDEPFIALARVLLTYPMRGPEALASMFARPDRSLARWDVLTRQRRVVALAGSDAHARLGWRRAGEPYGNDSSLKAPSYESIFRTFAIRAQLDRTLVGSASADAMTVRSALASGHVYSAVDAIAGPASLEFSASSGPFTARGGDSLVLGGPVRVEASVNSPAATMVLIENGKLVAESRSPLRYQAAERPAVFRVEARMPSAPGRPPVPWVVSNPIYAGGFVDPRRPRARVEPAAWAVVPAADATWAVERETRSQGAVLLTPPVAVTFHYTLSGGPPAGQFAALVNPVPGGLGSYDRLQFRAQADRPMRVSVQCRVGHHDTHERWQRSVYIDEELREITIFLDDLAPVGRTSRWLPQLAQVNSVMFVVDTVNTRPGTSGWVKLEAVRFGSLSPEP